ncbi:speA [Symbiodinium necroappetens]|uniref:Arginine decarboxylase n=1 Tax=Symbiodinium necroappetens TaxID=1628268 RepID=A0A813BD44_9DINO|nr:speA [Symbiodinium necroappetens]
MSTIPTPSNARTSPDTSTGWSVTDADAHYAVSSWGAGYFSVGERGTVLVHPDGEDSPGVDLHEIVSGLDKRGISAPVLLRFSGILANRLRRLRGAFDGAMEEMGYGGAFSAVYPIKVNQERHIVEEVARCGQELGFGLEVGSKPELLTVLAVTAGHNEQMIVCNGFKDARYIEAVALATKLGRKIVPVVESLRELELVVRISKEYDVRVPIGVRIKLSGSGSGRWKESVGSSSKFGLFVSELVEVMDRLKAYGMIDRLELLHCHAGSQMQDIRTVKSLVAELSQVYVDARAECENLKYLDIGGGLGVDYTGEHTSSDSSMNYTVEEFARDVVYRIGASCDAVGAAHPTIISECGRAMVAHASVLVVNVLGATGPGQLARVEATDDDALDRQGEIVQPLADLIGAKQELTEETALEVYHDMSEAYEAALSAFGLGYITLRQRSLAERLYWEIRGRLAEIISTMAEPPEELSDVNLAIPETYFCNFSLFQSLPDVWAIEQVFPVVPIHRLDEEPTRRVVLADITCDSDGKMTSFVSGEGVTPVLSAHPLRGEDYRLGIFLVGAYQEALGDLHNLFGETNAVHVEVSNGSWKIADVVRGETSEQVLGYMLYDPKALARAITLDCERAHEEGLLNVDEMRTFLRLYENGLSSYTYLESE